MPAALTELDDNEEATPLLLRAATDPELCVSERGLAMWGLALMADDLEGEVSHARQVHAVVLAALDDPSPTIRVNAIEAADSLRLEAAIPKLRRIARTDRSRVRYRGSVAQAARIALWSDWAARDWHREIAGGRG